MFEADPTLSAILTELLKHHGVTLKSRKDNAIVLWGALIYADRDVVRIYKPGHIEVSYSDPNLAGTIMQICKTNMAANNANEKRYSPDHSEAAGVTL